MLSLPGPQSPPRGGKERLMVEVLWLGRGRKRCRLVIAGPRRGQFILGSPLHTVASPALVLPSDRSSP